MPKLSPFKSSLSPIWTVSGSGARSDLELFIACLTALILLVLPWYLFELVPFMCPWKWACFFWNFPISLHMFIIHFLLTSFILFLIISYFRLGLFISLSSLVLYLNNRIFYFAPYNAHILSFYISNVNIFISKFILVEI